MSDLAFAVPSVSSVNEILSMSAVIARIEESIERFARNDSPLRTSIPTAAGELLIMPTASDRYFGTKLLSLAPDNHRAGLPRIQGLYVVFDAVTSAVTAVFDASGLTRVRTAAFSGWATSKLARQDARRLLVYGAGQQARAHVDAMMAVRPIDEIRVVSRTVASAEAMIAELAGRGICATVGRLEDQSWADIICCCTSSPVPIIEGARLAAGVHVNAIGSHQLDRRELDSATMVRARIAVETRSSALAEAGDIVRAIEEGTITSDDIEFDLLQLRSGAGVAASPDRDISVFKSVGVGFEDLLVAEMVAEKLATRIVSGATS